MLGARSSRVCAASGGSKFMLEMVFMRRIGKRYRRPPAAQLKAPRKPNARPSLLRRAWRTISSFANHPFLTSFLAAVLASGITAAVQYHVTNKQMWHADEQRLDEERRRRLAIAIMLINKLAAIEGHLRANYASPSSIPLAALEGWRVSTASLSALATDDLFLFDSMFLGHYGTLLMSLDTLSWKIDLLLIRHDRNLSTQISVSEIEDLKKLVLAGMLSGSYLMENLLRIHRGARIPTRGNFRIYPPPVEPN